MFILFLRRRHGGINPRKIVSKEEFEAAVADIKEEKGFVLCETPEEDSKVIGQLLDFPQGTFPPSIMKFVEGSENCVDCGRHYSLLDLANTGLTIHGKQFLRDVILGKYGYVLNSHPGGT